MEASEVEEGRRQLDQLCRSEYGRGLSDILTRPGEGQGESVELLGRLVGILLKQPFAEPRPLATRSAYSGANFAWDLKPEGKWPADVRDRWEYKVVDAIRREELPWAQTVFQFADYAQGERGFFGFLSQSFARYVCGDPEVRSKVERRIDEARRSGIDMKSDTAIIAAGGATIGQAVVEHVPSLGMLGVPATAGLVLILYSVGLDAFCRWASDPKRAAGDSADFETK